MREIKLYGYSTSPFVRKTGAFLYYKGLEFEHVPVNPTEPEKTIGHTGGTQVPVLEIDGEWQTESSAHARWLDQLFPGRPLCPADQHELVTRLDAWASDFLHSGFRAATEGTITPALRTYLWRMAAILNADTPLSAIVQHGWPEFVSQAPFIVGLEDEPAFAKAPMLRDWFLRVAEHLPENPVLIQDFLVVNSPSSI